MSKLLAGEIFIPTKPMSTISSISRSALRPPNRSTLPSPIYRSGYFSTAAATNEGGTSELRWGTLLAWQTAICTPASSIRSIICSALIPFTSPVLVPRPRAAHPAAYMASSITLFPPQCSGFESQTWLSMIIVVPFLPACAGSGRETCCWCSHHNETSNSVSWGPGNSAPESTRLQRPTPAIRTGRCSACPPCRVSACHGLSLSSSAMNEEAPGVRSNRKLSSP